MKETRTMRGTRRQGWESLTRGLNKGHNGHNEFQMSSLSNAEYADRHECSCDYVMIISSLHALDPFRTYEHASNKFLN